MATSVLMAPTDHQTTNPNPQDHDHHTIRRTSGRRKPKPGCDASSAKKNKQPQRGMGVEKLERHIMQERWKKMTEINTTNQGFSIPSASFSDPTLIPAQVSKMGGYGAPNVAQMGLNQNQSYLGFHPQMGLNQNVNVSLISKELSSTTNVVNCYSEHCNACHKKKKVNSENRVRSDMYMQQMCNVGDYGFLGLNIGDNYKMITNQENQGKGTKASLVHPVGYAVGDHGKQGVEVVAVHRKGSSSSERGSVLMEYEFFPSEKSCCTSDSSHNDELVMMKLVGGSETSCSSSSTVGFDASSCIDLSLKLSY